MLLERLRSAVARINPSIPADVREEAIKQVQRLNSPELIANNEAFHRMLTEGIKVTYQMEMLEDAIRRYHARVLTAAEVMDELINISREIVKSDRQAEAMGMSDYKYAFYTAVANNHSARELMQQDTLRELAVVLYERVKANASIDWTIKENVKARLKVIVKRTLRQFGYPPDMQKLATETVLKQAEMLAHELTSKTDNG